MALSGSNVMMEPRRIISLLCALFLLASILCLVISRDRYLRERIRVVFRPDPPYNTAPNLLVSLMQNDPPIGSALPNTTGGKLIRRINPGSNGYFVVSVGDCAGCIRADLGKWKTQSGKREICMVLLTSADKSHASSFLRQLKVNCPIAYDPDDNTKVALNAVWPGRSYLFTSDGKLAWIAKKPVPDYDPFTDAEFRAALNQR